MESITEIYERKIKTDTACHVCGCEITEGREIRFANRPVSEKVCMNCFNDPDYQRITENQIVVSIKKLSNEN